MLCLVYINTVLKLHLLHYETLMNGAITTKLTIHNLIYSIEESSNLFSRQSNWQVIKEKHITSL